MHIRITCKCSFRYYVWKLKHIVINFIYGSFIIYLPAWITVWDGNPNLDFPPLFHPKSYNSFSPLGTLSSLLFSSLFPPNPKPNHSKISTVQICKIWFGFVPVCPTSTSLLFKMRNVIIFVRNCLVTWDVYPQINSDPKTKYTILPKLEKHLD